MALDTMLPDELRTTDEVVYPVSDDMGESCLQLLIIHTLLQVLKGYFAKLERPVFVGGNQFFYYKRGDPRAVVAPDIYTIDDETTPDWTVKNWKVWEPDRKRPTLAIEVVSDEYRKDYADRLIERYQELGVRELIRYDPGYLGRKNRVCFSHFVRDEQGRLVNRPVIGDRVRSVAYDLWFVRHARDMLRVGVGPEGALLWPTEAEQAAAERAMREAEAERAAAAEAARAAEAEARAAEAEARVAAEEGRAAAEAEVLRLRAELAALRAGR